MKNKIRFGRNFLQVGLFLTLFGIAAFFASCSEQARQEPIKERVNSNAVPIGGLFRLNFPVKMSSVFPHNIVNVSALSMMNQVYEGLLRLDPVSEKIVPELAESYTVSDDGLVYTFYLRKGVYFQNDPAFKDGKGREMVADDVVHCFTKLCEPSPHNQNYGFVIDLIKGARSHYESGQAGNFDGIKKLDDYTVQIELEFPSPIFESILAHGCTWIFPRELFTYKDDVNMWCIGTGPFAARSIKMSEVIILERNKNYWRKDSSGFQLPYLDAVRCNFIEDENKQVNELLQGNLDLIMEVPYQKVAELKERKNSETADYHIEIVPRLRVEYFGFKQKSPMYSDIRVRKAINYAINRHYLTDSILKGYAVPAVHGIVPSAMPGYESQGVRGYYFNPDTARKLLADAGYPNGENFPVITLQINDGNSTILAVADAVQRMLTSELNLTVEISVLQRSMHYNNIENGNAGFWRDGWIGDYADPENFLRLFYGKLVPEDSVKASFLNTVRFKNAEFDKYFEAALRESDEKLRQRDYVHADQILMDNAAIAPLYYEQAIWLVNKKVRNLDYSGIGKLDLSTTYFDNGTNQSRAQPIR